MQAIVVTIDYCMFKNHLPTMVLVRSCEKKKQILDNGDDENERTDEKISIDFSVIRNYLI